MDLATLALSFALVLISAVLVAGHLRRRPSASVAEPEESAEPGERTGESRELDFRRRQFRRRMQGSLMVGGLGLVLASGELLPGDRSGYFWHLAHLLALLVLVGWLVLLAVADFAATRHFFSRVREAQFLEAARFHADLRSAAARDSCPNDGDAS